MNPNPGLVFDLDGTLSDPAVGVGRSFNYALSAFGYAPLREEDVSHYIGPPLDVGFAEITQTTSRPHLEALVSKFRERYADVGYAENSLYTGIPEALASLLERGFRLGVCTAKRSDFAERILNMFNLRDSFAFVSGGDMGIHKGEQLASLLSQGIISKRSTMIGDRAVDIKAAKQNGLQSVGVLWGHGSEQELLAARPDALLRSVIELPHLEFSRLHV